MFEEEKKMLNDILKLKDELIGRTRKIIFWYDPKEEYQDLIQELISENSIYNTEIIQYNNNSFWLRYHIEREELNKNIIVYLPSCEREKGKDNNLLDLELANKDLIFRLDATTMRLKNLSLTDDCRKVIDKYSKFFGNKKREERFKEFNPEVKTSNNIDLIITSILIGNGDSINEDDILKEIIRCYLEEDKKYQELFKFGDQEFILGLFNNKFGANITDVEELPKLYKALIFTAFAINLKDVDKVSKYKHYLFSKPTNIQVFMNNFMRDRTTKESFESLSQQVEKELDINNLITKMDIGEYISSDVFECVDKYIIEHITNKLCDGAIIYKTYKEYIDIRQNKYWFGKLQNEYNLLQVAIEFLEKISGLKDTIKIVNIDEFVKDYVDRFSYIDTLYRKIYFYFDAIEDKDMFIELKNKIENMYMNDFISELSIKWSSVLENMPSYSVSGITLQKYFYAKYVKPFEDKRNRTIVIISDGFRYECAKELNDRLRVLATATKSEIEYMQGLIPSYTKLGMASLLPNKQLERVKDSDDILVDGMACSSTKDRELVLKKENSNSIAIRYDELYDKTKAEWKKLFSGQKVVYIYHNTIDNTGEHDEDKIFNACDKAIYELGKLVKDLHTTFDGINAFITSDHGFFYKRGRVESYEKMDKTQNATKQKKRYSYSDECLKQEGILSINLDYIFGENSGYVNIPKGNSIFKKQGTGTNYVHGGILPQEIIIPVIDFKSNKTSKEREPVELVYSGVSRKITNATTYLEFLQNNNVDENNKPCRYLLQFEDEQGEKVSNECIIIADYENTNEKDRIFKEKFVFKAIQYDRNKNYYLTITNEETNIEVTKLKFTIDIAIINDFGF